MDLEVSYNTFTNEHNFSLKGVAKHIGIAYTTTPDEKHEIHYELNLEAFIATQYINSEPITKIDYLKEIGSD